MYGFFLFLSGQRCQFCDKLSEDGFLKLNTLSGICMEDSRLHNRPISSRVLCMNSCCYCYDAYCCSCYLILSFDDGPKHTKWCGALFGVGYFNLYAKFSEKEETIGTGPAFIIIRATRHCRKHCSSGMVELEAKSVCCIHGGVVSATWSPSLLWK